MQGVLVTVEKLHKASIARVGGRTLRALEPLTVRVLKEVLARRARRIATGKVESRGLCASGGARGNGKQEAGDGERGNTIAREHPGHLRVSRELEWSVRAR